MLTPDDLSIAESLLRSGRTTPEVLERFIQSLWEANKGRSLKDVLRDAGLLEEAAPESFAATMAPAGAAARSAAAALERTVVPGGDSGVRRSTDGPAKVPTRFGRFEVVREIARGGMGIVYRAHEPGLKRDVALKVMLAGEGASEEQVERFIREARAAAALQHPNIVQVYDVGQEKGMHYFAMEYVDGRGLDQVLKAEGPLNARMALRIVRDLARALQYAHERNIIHRDIKPGNVLLAQEKRAETSMAKSAAPEQRQFRVLLSDFGLAKEMGSGSNLTMSGNLIGTPAYMSPEQAAGTVSQIDARSDVYSLGAVAYEVLTGKTPFPGTTLAEVLADIRGAEPVPMRRLRPELHRDVEIIVMKAMAKEKARRYQTAEELADDIERYLGGEAILAAAPTLTYRAARFARRHWAGVSAALVCVLVLAVAGSLVGWRSWRDRRERESAVRDHVAQARRLIGAHETGKLQEAQVALNSAFALAKDDPEAARAQEELRLESLLVSVDGMIAAKNWEGARAVLDADTQFRGHPRVVQASRRAAGVSTLAAQSEEAGVEVDLVEPETGVLWDEETFPPVREAREAGICRPLGTAPVGPMDIAFGDYLLVFSRDNRALLVLPCRIERSSDFLARYRVVRVPGPGAQPSLDDAVRGVAPGTIVEIGAGDYPPLLTPVPAGVLLRPARAGEIVRFKGDGKLLVARGAHGGGLRDLEFQATGPAYGPSFAGAYRPSVARCRIYDTTDALLDFTECQDGLIRECVFARSPSPAAFASSGGSPGGLILMCRAEDVGWQGIAMRASQGRIVRCRVERATRAGIFCTGTGIEVSECVVRDCPEWGIVVEGTGAVIRDNLIVGCGTVAKNNLPGAIAGDGAGYCAHNTVIGARVNGILFTYPLAESRFLDNIVAGGAKKGLHVHDPTPGWQFDHNLFFGVVMHAGVTEMDCATLEDTRRASSSPLTKGTTMQAHGLDVDPKFADPAAGDGVLAPDSPARGAASDGTDIGARVEAIAADRISARDWIVRDIARRYAREGLRAAEKGDSAGAAALLRKARLLRPDDPAVAELAARLKKARD